MPAPSAVAAALRGALDERAPRLAPLLRHVDYEEAGAYQPDLLGLKAKYLLLRPDGAAPALQPPVQKENEISLPSAKNILFPLSSVKHGYRQSWQVGSGMQNMGNTCYLNSTLQALFHVSAFANWLASENHSDRCGQNGCIICSMKKTLHDTQTGDNSIKPWQVYSKLRSICRHLVPGRQEDAHEFLRYLVEAMEKAYLSQFDGSGSHLDQYSKETTPLNQILGGYLRSVVKCLACNRVSTTFQHFQDLLVDARKASTIDEALEAFFSRERLEDLGYKCDFCNKKVSATKQFHIERAPMVLCIALKRFSITGGKLTKHVQFRPKLSLNKFMFKQNNSQSLTYRLVSVVTHLGHSQNSGHYTAVGLGPAGSFYQFDDSCVREISISSMLNTNAYIMFYELIPPNMNFNNSIKSNVSSTPLSSCQSYKDTSSNFIGPVMPKMLKEFNTIKLDIPLMDRDKLSNTQNGKIINDHSLSLNFHSNENGTKDTSIPNKDKLMPSTSNIVLKSVEQKPNGILKIHGDNLKQPYTNGNKLVPVSDNVLNMPSCSKTSNGVVKSLLNAGSIPNGKLNTDKRLMNGNSIDPVKLTNGNHSGESNGEIKTNAVQTKQVDSENGLPKIKSKPNGVSPLVPYECESSGETQDEDDKNTQKSKQLNSISTSQGWRVSCEIPENRQQRSQSNGEASSQSSPTNDRTPKDREILSQLQRQSHRGYGGPVDTWAGTHAQLNRQVYSDKKNELKRGIDAEDDMDRGRNKKMRYNNYNRYQNGRNNNYNHFQETQNQMNKWGGGKHGYRKNHHYNRNFKYKPKARFGQSHSHHSNNHYHQYNRNH